jgi:hypothetical protein
MAKLRDQPITASDISEYLAAQDDFNLELYVYNTAKAMGISATHGGTYEDPVTKKSRQYDVRAAVQRGNSRIDLAIECKSLQPSFPLLISRIPRLEEESFHELIYSFEPSDQIKMLLMNPIESRALSLWGDQSIYRRKEFVGKATAQIGRTEKGELVSGDTKVFDKWSQALASADELVFTAAHAHENYKMKMFLTFVLPVLVVSDGTLWVADYSADGVLETSPAQVEEALLFVGRTRVLYRASFRIFTYLRGAESQLF